MKLTSLIVVSVLLAMGTTHGAVTILSQTTFGNTSPTTPASSTDLLQTSLASVSPVVVSDNQLIFPAKYNGTTGTAHESTGSNPANTTNSGTYDFFLNTTNNFLGYKITAINTYTGWGDFRAGQDQTVWVSLVGSAAWVQIADINVPHSDGTLLTRVTDTTGLIATGVDAIRIVVDSGGFVYREVDVIGFVAPEPSRAFLLMLGAIAVVRRRRR